MSLSGAISAAFTRAAQESKALRSLINAGASDLSGLTTTTKSSLVAAINEIKNAVALSLNTQTGTSYFATLVDAGNAKLTVLSNSNTVVYTIPASATTDFPIGSVLNGTSIGTGQVVITPAAGVTFLGGAYKSARAGAVWTSIKVAADTWVVNGDLVA